MPAEMDVKQDAKKPSRLSGQGTAGFRGSLLVVFTLVLLAALLPGDTHLGLTAEADASAPVVEAGAAGLADAATSTEGAVSAAGGDAFSDVPAGHPYAVAIDALRESGVIAGYLDGGRWLFKPDNPVLRAQFAKMICGALDLPVSEGQSAPFSDLGPNDPNDLYPNDYVAAVAARGITTGTAPGLFSPWSHITRAQLVTMAVRAANVLAPGVLSIPPVNFTGTLGSFDPNHDSAMRTAEFNGLLAGLEGFGSTWDPWADASRGETAQILFKLMGVVGSSGTGSSGGSGGGSGTGTGSSGGSGGTGGGSGGSPAQPLGANAAITFRLFPADNPWNTDISNYPVLPQSDRYIASIGRDKGLHPDFGTTWNGAPNGIPYVVVSGSQPRAPISFYYADESDPGPYPIPADAPIEGGPSSTGDRHVLVLDATHRLLYEIYDAHFKGDHWEAGSGAVWDLTSNALRPDTWTSADAAGLPMLPGLVRYDEVASGEITHALRVTVSRTQRAFIHPATHYASDSTDPDLPPMGLRLRLRSDFDISGFPARVQVILRALKKYGMFVADNGGDWYISGAPDPRWDDDELHVLSEVPGSAFEAVDTGAIITK